MRIDFSLYKVFATTNWLVALIVAFSMGMAGCALTGQPPDPPPPVVFKPTKISAEAARSALIGSLKGTTVCGNKVGVEFRITEAVQEEGRLSLHGAYRSLDVPGQPKAPELDSAVAGSFDLNTGLLQLNSIVEKDNGCYSWMPKTFFGNEMACNQGHIEGTIEKAIRAPGRKAAAEHNAASSFALIASRNGNDSTGWSGIIHSPSFSCASGANEVALQSEKNAGALPAITAEQALLQAKILESGPATNGPDRVYWLNFAANLGERDGFSLLGKAFGYGEGVQKDYSRAFGYYKIAAERGDARAQGELAHLYEEGLGTKKNLAESKRWMQLHDATKRAAAKVCLANETLRAVNGLMMDSLSDPTAIGLQFMLEWFNGVAVDTGSFRIVDVQEQGVSSMDRPFGCMVTAIHLDMVIRDVSPSYEYVGTDRFGTDFYKDRRFEKYMSENFAAVMQKAMNGSPFIQPFSVEAQANKDYKIKLVPQMIALSREYSTTVHLP